MRNTVILGLIIVIVFAAISCKKEGTSVYTGTYTGKLTSANFVKDDVQLTFTNASNNKTLCLFDIALTKISENQFSADAKVVLEIIHLFNADITADKVSNPSATFVFEDGEVTMDMKYNSSEQTDNINVRYIGKK